MPRKITHFYTSQDAAKAARLEGRSGDAAASAAGRLRPYFCSSTGAHLLTTDADLDDERSPLPRRRTDGALVLDESKHTVRLYLVDGGVKVVSRRGGIREKQLRLCVACEAGSMPDVRGSGEKPPPSSAAAPAAAAAAAPAPTTILLPVAYRTDARSKLLYILPGALTSLAGGGVLPEEALAEAAGAAAALASGTTTLLSSSSDSASGRKQLALARKHQQLQRQKLLPPPSCVLPLRGGGCQASILILQGGEKRGGRGGRARRGRVCRGHAGRFRLRLSPLGPGPLGRGRRAGDRGCEGGPGLQEVAAGDAKRGELDLEGRRRQRRRRRRRWRQAEEGRRRRRRRRGRRTSKADCSGDASLQPLASRNGHSAARRLREARGSVREEAKLRDRNKTCKTDGALRCFSTIFISILHSFFYFLSQVLVLSSPPSSPSKPLRRRHKPLRSLSDPSPRRLPQRPHRIDLRLREAPRGEAREREGAAAAVAEADLRPGSGGAAEARGREGGVELPGGGGGGAGGGGRHVAFLLAGLTRQRGRRRSGSGVGLCSVSRDCGCGRDFLALLLLPRDGDCGGRGEQRRLGILPREQVDV